MMGLSDGGPTGGAATGAFAMAGPDRQVSPSKAEVSEPGRAFNSVKSAAYRRSGSPEGVNNQRGARALGIATCGVGTRLPNTTSQSGEVTPWFEERARKWWPR